MYPPKDAATYLGVAVSSLAKWRVLGTGPTFIKIGAAVRYGFKDLEEWLELRSARSTSEISVRRF